MRYSYDKPTGEGWYFMKIAWVEKPVKIYNSVTGLRVKEPFGPGSTILLEKAPDSVRWAGPIEMPKPIKEEN